MAANMHIENEDFDREYGLEDLLPRQRTAEWLDALGGRLTAGVLQRDGAPYCGTVRRSDEWMPEALRVLGATVACFHTHSGTEAETVVHPLRHELETIGFLVLQAIRPADRDETIRLAAFAARGVERMMQLTYRTRMTSGLHGRVVEDSFARLTEKTRQLQSSEEKYRHLAQRLEMEVQRQTEEIKAAQLVMFQQEKLASIGRLSAGVAHEINNPIGFVISNLNSLRGICEDLLQLLERHDRLAALVAGDGGEGEATGRVDMVRLAVLAREIAALREDLDIDYLKEDLQALIDESLEGAQRVRTIVRQLTDFAHPSIETAESVDIRHCLDTTLSILASEIGPEVTVRKAYQPVPAVLCHLRALNQVFFHLLRNALQAVEGRGTITLTTRPTDDNCVEVEVADDGPGISAEQLPRIFDPFFTTRDVGQGAGLGLHLAYNIMQQHGGAIHAANRPEGGCRFLVHMPVQRGA